MISKEQIKKQLKKYKKEITTSIVTIIIMTILCLTIMPCYKIAAVDVKRIVAKSSQVTILNQEQQIKTQELQKWLDGVKKEVENQKAKKDKESLLAKYNVELANKQKEIKTVYAQKLQNVYNDISNTIAIEAKRLGYKAVISKDYVLYGATDITAEVEEKIK